MEAVVFERATASRCQAQPGLRLSQAAGQPGTGAAEILVHDIVAVQENQRRLGARIEALDLTLKSRISRSDTQTVAKNIESEASVSVPRIDLREVEVHFGIGPGFSDGLLAEDASVLELSFRFGHDESAVRNMPGLAASVLE
jgi:hypothetical protein